MVLAGSKLARVTLRASEQLLTMAVALHKGKFSHRWHAQSRLRVVGEDHELSAVVQTRITANIPGTRILRSGTSLAFD